MVVEAAPQAPSLTPFVRWAGGKRWLASALVPEILATKPSLYVEPFLGGGAVALALPSQLPKALGDVNAQLIDCWRCIQRMPGNLLMELQQIEQVYGNEQDGYLVARDEFNFMVRNPRPMWLRRSALFLYLNARCFNGLWRTNAKGLFNVPYGKLALPRSITGRELGDLSAALFGADLRAVPYGQLLGDLRARRARCYRRANDHRILQGIAVYADPPYDGTFDKYAKDGFDDREQEALASTLSSWASLGAAIWATNADTPLVRDLYAWAQIDEIVEHHHLGATGNRRGKRGCLLIRGGAAR